MITITWRQGQGAMGTDEQWGTLCYGDDGVVKDAETRGVSRRGVVQPSRDVERDVHCPFNEEVGGDQ